MKKKILSMLLVATLITSIFTGCGAGGSKEITVSEMLDSILEENGEVVMYTFLKDGSKWTEDYAPSKNTEVGCIVYDGETETTTWMISSETGDPLLGSYLDGTRVADKEASNKDLCNQPVNMKLEVDADGNVLCERLNSCSFGEFQRKEINGVSCMIFATYVFYVTTYDGIEQRVSGVSYTIIPDTEFTQDKTVVLDTADTEGIEVVKDDSKLRNGKLTFATQDRNWTFSE